MMTPIPDILAKVEKKIPKRVFINLNLKWINHKNTKDLILLISFKRQNDLTIQAEIGVYQETWALRINHSGISLPHSPAKIKMSHMKISTGIGRQCYNQKLMHKNWIIKIRKQRVLKSNRISNTNKTKLKNVRSSH